MLWPTISPPATEVSRDLANDKRTVKGDPSMTDQLDFQRLEHELLLAHSASRTGKGSLPSEIYSSRLFPNAR